MANEKVDMANLFHKFLATYKHTQVIVNGQQAQIECSSLWSEINKAKDTVATKSEAQKPILNPKT